MFPNPLATIRREIPYKFGKSKVPPPQTIFIVVNSICNLRCKMCDIGLHEKDTQFYKNMNTGEELSIPTIQKLVEEVRSYNPLMAIISTEPLLHPRIIEIIKIIRENGMKVQLTTNGYKLPEFSEMLVESDLDILYVSIDGTRKVHNEIRGNENAWDNAVLGMRLVYNYKEKTKKKYPKVRVNYTISGYNYDSMHEFLLACHVPEGETEPWEISRYYGHIDFCHLNMITQGMATAHNVLYPDITATPSSTFDSSVMNVDIDRLWDEIQEIKSNYSPAFVSFTPDMKTKQELDIYYNRPEQFLTENCKCKVPWKSAQILANGDLGIATRCFNVKLGNIKESGFMDLWNGEKMQNFRNELYKAGAFPACSRCCGVF